MSPARLVCIFAILALALPAAAQKPRTKETSFIYLRDGGSATMSGTLTDLQRVKKRLPPGKRVLWFRAGDGKEYVVRDLATLDQFAAVWKAADALAEQQGVIGEKMGAIGTKQGAIGTKQGAIGTKQGAIGTKQGELEERAAEATTRAERDAIDRERRALDAQMRELDRQMQALDAQMAELQKPMDAFDQQMDALGKKHEIASKQAEIDAEALFARAITSGVAKPF